jgi:hypothetical protein
MAEFDCIVTSTTADCARAPPITSPTARQSHARVARRFLAAAVVLILTTNAHAAAADDGENPSKQLREQNKTLSKKVEQLEKRLRKLETGPARRRPTKTAQAGPAQPPAVYRKAPPPNDDHGLTWHGITVYGMVDMGLTYQNHAAPLNQDVGLAYLISKNSNRSYFGAAPNALSASVIGVKGDEELLPGLHGIFNLQTTFEPTSGKLFDGLGSIVQNNGLAATAQTTFADSSKDGQPLNTAAYAGLSSKYGTLTYGRQNSLTLDGVLVYDPMGASGAFSLIGFQGATAGMGDTGDARLDNSLKYTVSIGPFRAAAAAQLSPTGAANRGESCKVRSGWTTPVFRWTRSTGRSRTRFRPLPFRLALPPPPHNSSTPETDSWRARSRITRA